MDVLTSKTIKSSDYYSRYSGFYYYYNKLDEKEETIKDTKGNIVYDSNGDVKKQNISKYQMSTSSWLKPVESVVAHTVVEGDTFDKLALTYYGNPTMYWIICDYNRIINPFIEPEIGDVLYIPSRSKNLEFKHY